MKRHNAGQFGLHKKNLPHSIVEVVASLQKAGFEAYIVGGGVRDSLLGLAPKDFDAVTNARPHEIKAVFGSRCRIIGKRFLLAHVYSGREMIEVATFRAAPTDDHHKSHDGMIVRDNVWGNIHDDFERRDFTINALYYDPIKGEILDFCTALKDIKNKTIRLLGKPKLRIKEDPVRLLRALRFRAKLDFSFDKSLAKEFCDKNWQLLEQVSAHRLYDETQKMFGGGYLSALLPLLYRYGAIKALLAHCDDKPTDLMMALAHASDERIRQGRGANVAYVYAALLWDSYLYQLKKLTKKHPFIQAQIKAAAHTIACQRTKTAIPKFAEEFIAQIWFMQPKLAHFDFADVAHLVRSPRFYAAYDFLVVREQADQNPLAPPTHGMGLWWTQFLTCDDKARQQMLADLSSQLQSAANWPQSKLATPKLPANHSLSSTGLVNDVNSFDQKAAPQKIKRKPLLFFEKISYTEADFQQILGDEPFIPPKRRHKSSINSCHAILKNKHGQKLSPTKAKKSRQLNNS